MTLYEFNSLDETGQHEAVWYNGVMVGDRIEGEHKIILYQLFSFYVELFYNADHKVLQRLKSLSNTELLDGYIDKFNLNTMLKKGF